MTTYGTYDNSSVEKYVNRWDFLGLRPDDKKLRDDAITAATSIDIPKDLLIKLYDKLLIKDPKNQNLDTIVDRILDTIDRVGTLSDRTHNLFFKKFPADTQILSQLVNHNKETKLAFFFNNPRLFTPLRY